MSPGMQGFDSSRKITDRFPAAATSSSSRSDKSDPPKRLRYWLIDMINSGEIPGLQWEDPTHTVFRIPWKHAGKNNWKEEDCKIFQAWAEHRGKYKKGDKVEPATWKTRLRCALNKLPDIKELKEKSYLEGNEPYRVYQLLPEADKTQENEIYPRSSWGKESPSSQIDTSPNRFNSPPSTHNAYSYGLNPLYQTISGYHASPGLSSPPRQPMRPGHSLLTTPPMIPTSEFKKLKVEERNLSRSQSNGYTLNKIDIVPPDMFNDIGTSVHHPNSIKRNLSNEVYEPFSPVSSGHSATMLQPHGTATSPGSSPNGNSHLTNMDTYTNFAPMIEAPLLHAPIELPFPEMPPETHEMEIYIRYRGHPVKTIHVVNQAGCRVHFGNANLQLIAMASHELPSVVFGPESLQQIELCPCEKYSVSEKQVTLTRHVLNNIKRGLIIQFENGCFYVKRLCQSRVFITSPECTEETPERLERNVKVKVFDCNKFCHVLRQYIVEGKMKPPEIEINASFGQNWSIKTPLEKNLVTLTMIPRFAKYLRFKVREKHNRFESLNDSILSDCGPDSYDHIAELATMQSDKGVNESMDQMTHQDPNFVSSARPMTEHQQQQSYREPHAYLPRSGLFQTTTFTSSPMLPPLSISDVEMTTGYSGEPYSKETGRLYT